MSFNQKPFLVSSSSALFLGEKSFKVYLDINNKSRLEGYYFECDEADSWFSYFDSLSKELERVRLVDIDKVVELWKQANKEALSSQLINLPTALLYRALDQYNGRDLGHSQVSKNSSSNLICRCFGVYDSQIEELAKGDSDITLMKVASELKATVGCGSCIDDINSRIKFYKSKYSQQGVDKVDFEKEFDDSGNRIKPLGMSPSEVVLKIDSLKKSWIKEQELKDLEMEILSIKGHTLFFSLSGRSNTQYILETFNEYINDRLGLVFSFNLTQ